MNPFLVGPDGELPLPWLDEPLAQMAAHRGHALLLHGGEGRGLFELAMTAAQTALCSQPVDGIRPCGRCDDCHLVLTQVHPDLHLLLPPALRPVLGWHVDGDDESAGEGKAKPSQQIRIEDMRAAIDWGTLSVSRDRAKVLVIHPATRMNPATANALLKTLEEPPGLLRLILTARSPRVLLPTIASRCQHVRVAAPSRDVAMAWLAAQGVVGADSLLRAGGEPLLALDLASQGIDAARWQRVPQAVRQGDTSVFAGWPLPAVVDALCKLCHDTMCVHAGADARYFDTKTVPRGASWPALRTWSMDLSRATEQASHPWHAVLAVDALVFRASRVWV